MCRCTEARTLLPQDRDGGIPKVIANKVAVLSTGEWLMPFWREQQNALEVGLTLPGVRLVTCCFGCHSRVSDERGLYR